MATRNDITGAEIKSRALSAEGRDRWDSIFGVKKTAHEWLKMIPHFVLMGPDGWRENDGVTLETKITREDFNRRLNVSTVMRKPYSLFLDDFRNPLAAYLDDEKSTLIKKSGVTEWFVVRSYTEFCAAIDLLGLPENVSFDHDLTAEHVDYFFKYTAQNDYIEYENFKEKTGKHCAEYLVSYVKKCGCKMPTCYVHSANPVGRREIKKILNQ